MKNICNAKTISFALTRMCASNTHTMCRMVHISAISNSTSIKLCALMYCITFKLFSYHLSRPTIKPAFTWNREYHQRKFLWNNILQEITLSFRIFTIIVQTDRNFVHMLDSCEIEEIFYCLSWKIKYFFNTIWNCIFVVTKIWRYRKLSYTILFIFTLNTIE